MQIVSLVICIKYQSLFSEKNIIDLLSTEAKFTLLADKILKE